LLDRSKQRSWCVKEKERGEFKKRGGRVEKKKGLAVKPNSALPWEEMKL